MKIKILIFTTFVVAALAACRNGDTDIYQESFASFTCSIDGAHTRVVNDTEWEDGDEIGISGTSSDGATSAVNIKFVAKADSVGQWVFESATPISYGSTKPVTFTAYYPYSSESSEISFSIAGNDGIQTDDIRKSTDYLFARGTGSQGNPKVALAFRHCMSRVELTFEKGEDVESLEGLSYSLDGVSLAGKFDGTTGDVTPEGDKGKIEITPGDATVASSLLLVPDETVNTMTLGVVLDGKDYSTTLSLPASTNNQLLSGYCVKYTVLLNRNLIYVIGVFIEDMNIIEWTPGNNITITGSFDEDGNPTDLE